MSFAEEPGGYEVDEGELSAAFFVRRGGHTIGVVEDRTAAIRLIIADVMERMCPERTTDMKEE